MAKTGTARPARETGRCGPHSRSAHAAVNDPAEGLQGFAGRAVVAQPQLVLVFGVELEPALRSVVERQRHPLAPCSAHSSSMQL